MVLLYFREEVLLRNALYFANIICNFPQYLQLFATPVFANQGIMHLDGQRWQWAGDEALGVQHLQRRAKWLSARTGCLHTACHNFSAGERCTLSCTQNSSGNPHARIYTPEWPALSRQQMVTTYQDTRSSVQGDNWKTKILSIVAYQIRVVHQKVGKQRLKCSELDLSETFYMVGC